jgi:hypothetical protein
MTQYRMSQYTNVYQHPVLGHVRSPFIPLTLFTLTLFGNTLMSTNILYWVMSGHLSFFFRGIKGDLT